MIKIAFFDSKEYDIKLFLMPSLYHNLNILSREILAFVVSAESYIHACIMYNLHYLTSINSFIALIATSIAFPSSVGFTMSYLLGI